MKDFLSCTKAHTLKCSTPKPSKIYSLIDKKHNKVCHRRCTDSKTRWYNAITIFQMFN